MGHCWDHYGVRLHTHKNRQFNSHLKRVRCEISTYHIQLLQQIMYLLLAAHRKLSGARLARRVVVDDDRRLLVLPRLRLLLLLLLPIERTNALPDGDGGGGVGAPDAYFF